MTETQAEVDDLKAQVQRLTQQSSSLLPSIQHLHARPVPKARAKSTRKRGGQPGHRRVVRKLDPVERSADMIALHLEACRRCGQRLAGRDPELIRH